MKKIASSVYENLTARQRVIASIEAEARGDASERRRLTETCPKKTYRQYEIEYSGTLETLMCAAMAIECDLRGCALKYLVAICVDPENAGMHLQEFANIRAAWKTTIFEMGIDPKSMQKAGPPPSPILEWMDRLIPEPVNEGVEELVVGLEELIGLEYPSSYRTNGPSI